MAGRDSHLIKELLNVCTPVQVLHGIYSYAGNGTCSIPIFCSQREQWLEKDDQWAEVLLAVVLTKYTPPEYYTYMDLRDEQSNWAFGSAFEARQKLREWANEVFM